MFTPSASRVASHLGLTDLQNLLSPSQPSPATAKPMSVARATHQRTALTVQDVDIAELPRLSLEEDEQDREEDEKC